MITNKPLGLFMVTKPKFILVPDTNILWKKDKNSVANQEFEDFWKEVSSNYLIELVIPEVVEGELIFQHYSSAINRLGKLKDNLSELNSIAEKKYRFRPKKEDLKKGVEKKFKKWLSQHKGEIYKTPLKKINWEAIQKKAVWRELPFKSLDINSKSEKKQSSERTRDDDGGFRDSLIFETVKEIHASSGEKFVLFISDDNFLREALDKLLGSFEDYFSHESLDEALSTIKLKEEKLTKAFATQIQKRAQKKFFDINNQKTLWYKDEIPYKITEKYPEQLKPVEIEGAFSGGLFGQGSSLPEWNS
ncbi:MAG: DUF4935 domain-containing protein, partial [Nitrospinae bacterium]|nr:DUF4935 domain-containing protein [Nitrospinota bacterium]